MKEHPILFSSEMVRAMLDGRKSQTRRVIKPQPGEEYNEVFYWALTQAEIERRKGWVAPFGCWVRNRSKTKFHAPCLYGMIGDRLWVREALVTEKVATQSEIECGHFTYKADEEGELWAKEHGFRTIPSIHMPRWASRITLEIVDVRVEQVQEINNLGALAEGTPDLRTMENNWDLRDCYRQLWDLINAKRGYGWDANPWVWVIEFGRVA